MGVGWAKLFQQLWAGGCSQQNWYYLEAILSEGNRKRSYNCSWSAIWRHTDAFLVFLKVQMAHRCLCSLGTPPHVHMGLNSIYRIVLNCLLSSVFPSFYIQHLLKESLKADVRNINWKLIPKLLWKHTQHLCKYTLTKKPWNPKESTWLVTLRSHIITKPGLE